MLKKVWGAARIAIGIALLVILLLRAGIGQIEATLAATQLLYLPAIIVLFALALFIGALNVKLLTDALQVRMKMSEMLSYYLTSWAFGLMIPGKLGEFSFVYLAKKHLSIGKATAVSVIDKIITVITLCILAFIGFFLLFPLETALRLSLISLIIVIAGLAFVLTGQGRNMAKKILGKYQTIFKGFAKDVFYLIANEKKALLSNVILTFVKWAVAAILTYFIFLSLGQHINLFLIMTISAVVTLLSLIPITISGLGIKEGAAVFLYGTIGVHREITVSAYLILLALNYAAAALIFMFVKK